MIRAEKICSRALRPRYCFDRLSGEAGPSSDLREHSIRGSFEPGGKPSPRTLHLALAPQPRSSDLALLLRNRSSHSPALRICASPVISEVQQLSLHNFPSSSASFAPGSDQPQFSAALISAQ